jgi:tetratricopeptide (TPR) repeat protein
MAFLPSPSVPVPARLPRIVFTVLCAAIPCAALPAASDSSAFQKDGERQLEEGRILLDADTLNAARNSFAQCSRQDPKNVPCLLDLARAEFYLVRVGEIAGHGDASHKMLDNAVTDAQKAVALNDGSADAHALLADLYGAKITGMMSGMKYGPKANTESQRALQLDPNNAFVYAVLGRKYFYSPSAFGGDINKAIDSFKHAAALDPHSDEDLVWLAKAYRKKGDTAHEKEALTQALNLNPRSVFAQRIQTGKE